MQTYTEKQQRTVLERMIKCSHPALDSSNKGKVEKLFTFLMQYVHDISTGPNLSLLNEMAPIAFDLVQIVPSSHAASTLLDVLLEKREEFTGKGKKRPVSIATVSLIFNLLRFASHMTT
jgi:nucleolar protein 14